MRNTNIDLGSVKKWLGSRLQSLHRRVPHRLRLLETLGLGERRLIAVIEFDRRKFLVGGTGESVCLLADLSGRKSRTCVQDTIPTWSFSESGTGVELNRCE